jgi:hypothetical protein
MAPEPALNHLPAQSKPRSKPAFAAKPTTATFGKVSNHRHQGQNRRRVFDYNRYFSDLMGTVSNYTSGIEPVSAPVNGSSVDLPEPNAPKLPVSPHLNGNTPKPTAPATSILFDANQDLIANQASFIEEQRRLMQEQTRLIEEKSKLIAEKNQLLKLQSELFENKLV